MYSPWSINFTYQGEHVNLPPINRTKQLKTELQRIGKGGGEIVPENLSPDEAILCTTLPYGSIVRVTAFTILSIQHKRPETNLNVSGLFIVIGEFCYLK